MSLGFGKMTPKEYADLQTTPQDDQVPPGKYFVRAERFNELKPKPPKAATGTLFLTCRTTDSNADYIGKRVTLRYNYHPDPASDRSKDYEQMNDISERNMKATLLAANSEIIVENGAVDLVRSIARLAEVGAVFPVVVSHGTDRQGNPRQDIAPTTVE